MGTLAELHFGVLVAREPNVRAERLRRLSILHREFDALPIDDAVAASYGSWPPLSLMPATNHAPARWTC